jgi:NitT/TauT family transport system ATP-binding protein
MGDTDRTRTKGISLDGVSLTYTRDDVALEAIANVTLKAEAGEFISLVGPSGCGKSSLLRITLGLVPPTRGRVEIGGSPVTGPRKNVGMVFQSPVLLPWLTIEQNVILPAVVARSGRGAARVRASELLAQVGLAGFESRYPYELSGGMQQRAAIARALLQDPDVMLMDEPFAALDAQTRDLLHDELERIWAETRRTIVFVTHNVREAVRLGDRVALLTFRPGQVKREYEIDLPRPRHLEDVHVAGTAREILDDLREEINRSLQEEYGEEEHGHEASA